MKFKEKRLSIEDSGLKLERSNADESAQIETSSDTEACVDGAAANPVATISFR